MLTVHHLGVSQSERIVWLLEELGLEYNFVKHIRDPIFAPQSLKSVPGNITGRAPAIEDSDAGITLGESGAICEYITHVHANGRLYPKPGDKNYVDFIYWFHWANAGLQPGLSSAMNVGFANLPDDSMLRKFAFARLEAALKTLDARLKESKYLAGDDLTVADIMVVYSLTTQRYWGPTISWAPYPGIVRFLTDVAARPAYRRAMEKGDPEMELLTGPEPPKTDVFHAGGVGSDFWKKRKSAL